MGAGVSQSRFYMWRAIFALAHADHEVSDNEQGFMRDALKAESFSREQRRVLEQDIEVGQNPGDMFAKIAEQEDRSRFFYYARMLCWCDGHFDEQEQEIMQRLTRAHIENIDFPRLLESLDMELEEEIRQMLIADMGKQDHPLLKFLKRLKQNQA